ncbi:hypothetical protein D3C77_658580 [compost metagenome]
MASRRSTEFCAVLAQARACTRIRSVSGAVPRPLRLMICFWRPSVSITKVRKNPSGGVRFSALRAMAVRKVGLALDFCAHRVLRVSTSSSWPYTPSRSKKMLLLSRVAALGLSIHWVK